MHLRRIALLTLASVAVFGAVVFATIASAQSNETAGTQVAAQQTPTAIVSPTATPTPSPSPTPDLPPTPTAVPTPQVISPAELVNIPEELIATPTPVAVQRQPLPVLTNIPAGERNQGVVYLTFDDGPHPVYTDQVLALLAQYNARATFFMIGNSVDAYPSIAARVVAQGHAVGNHTYRHVALPSQTDEEIIAALANTQGALGRATGVYPSCLRPPYGSLDQRSYDVVKSQGFNISMWEVDSKDWQQPGTYEIASNVLSRVRLGSRVLFHDGPANRAQTVEALAQILDILSRRGVQFEALPTC